MEHADWAVLARYLAGESDAGERTAVEAWVALDPARGRALAGLTQAAAMARAQRGDWDTSAALSAIARRAGSTEASLPIDTVPAFQPIRWALGIAVLGLLMVGGWYGLRERVAAQAVREFVTPAGSRATITLRDGTRVVMGPESRIRIPASFGVRDRVADLEGEAYFAVVHDVRHPFAVTAHGVRSQDIGTEFDVRAYASDSAVRIVVAQGEVAVGADLRPDRFSPSTILLHATDVASVSASGIRVARHADITAATAWVQGRLVFDETPLVQVVHDLSRTFDLSITVADSTLATHRITASFTNESAEEVLNDIAGIVGGRYERNGKKVTITRAPTHVRAPSDNHPIPMTTTDRRGVGE